MLDHMNILCFFYFPVATFFMGQSNTIQTVDFDGFDVLKTIFGSTSGQHPAHIWKDMLHGMLFVDHFTRKLN